MKKQFIAIFAAFFLMVGAVSAQDAARGPKMSAEEKLKAAIEKIDAELKPAESVRESAKAILHDYYNNLQKEMQELRASGSQSREDFIKLRQQLSTERDAKLKAIFSTEQMTKWTQEIEPALNQRPKGEQKEKF